MKMKLFMINNWSTLSMLIGRTVAVEGEKNRQTLDYDRSEIPEETYKCRIDPARSSTAHPDRERLSQAVEPGSPFSRSGVLIIV